MTQPTMKTVVLFYFFFVSFYPAPYLVSVQHQPDLLPVRTPSRGLFQWRGSQEALWESSGYYSESCWEGQHRRESILEKRKIKAKYQIILQSSSWNSLTRWKKNRSCVQTKIFAPKYFVERRLRGAVVKWLHTASESKGRMFEAHHDPCSLVEGEATLPSPEK